LLTQEGIEFKTNSFIGKDISVDEIKNSYDFICLCGGSETPRDLPVKGRDLKGVYFALDFLFQQNRINGGRELNEEIINAKGKQVVVIGGGDTGSDCVGTSIRQGAKSVTQIEILPKPPRNRTADNPWPQWPNILKTSSSQEEGCKRDFSVLTKEFRGDTQVSEIKCVKVDWSQSQDDSSFKMKEIKGSEFTIKADLVLLSMGFVHPVHEGLLKDLGLKLDERGNVWHQSHRTSVKNIYVAGDMATGQSLVVRAIASGRNMAKMIDTAIKGHSHLS
ncbi:MAG: FAD-dependent oxidoreductase, partial [Deltaproteobacteria bacterium]|nr:FAD-dependent oxidoreductase [Deltaproteobacteria bacterium]